MTGERCYFYEECHRVLLSTLGEHASFLQSLTVLSESQMLGQDTQSQMYCTTSFWCHNRYHSTNLFSPNFVEKKLRRWCQLSAPVASHCFYMVWIPISMPSVYLVCGACQNMDLLLNFLRHKCLIVRGKKPLVKFYGICQTQIHFWSIQVIWVFHIQIWISFSPSFSLLVSTQKTFSSIFFK